MTTPTTLTGPALTAIGRLLPWCEEISATLLARKGFFGQSVRLEVAAACAVDGVTHRFTATVPRVGTFEADASLCACELFRMRDVVLMARRVDVTRIVRRRTCER